MGDDELAQPGPPGTAGVLITSAAVVAVTGAMVALAQAGRTPVPAG